ncbi:MAG: PDZ domain-containing protein, partial [Akkermansiaceae bacterium]
IFLMCSFMFLVFASAEEIPRGLVEGLASEKFKQREESQQAVEKWTNEKGPAAVTAVYKLYISSDDPEVRNRCYRILRVLSEKDYMNDGKGYLGVQLAEEMIENGDKPRFGIRITYIMPGSQAEVAGIKVGDVIASMDGKKWNEQGALNELINTVASYKPLRKVVFEVKREGEKNLLEIPVILGKRPVENLSTSTLYYNNIEQLEKEAREKHFTEWLKNQKAE